MKSLILLLSLLLATNAWAEARGLECKSDSSSFGKVNFEEVHDTYWYRIDFDKGRVLYNSSKQNFLTKLEDLIGDKKQDQILMSEVPVEKVCFYACEDADIVLKIYNKQKKILENMALENIFYNIEMPLINVLVEMEYNGLFIDVKMISPTPKS